ncbi:unnamed protein product, partial [Phaeothamnion confervicola]
MTNEQRAAKADELRQRYLVPIEYFVSQGTCLLEKLRRTRSNAESSTQQVKKLYQYVKEGHNAIQYMERCMNGHVPSAPSLLSLEHTLQKVDKASHALQDMIHNHATRQGAPHGGGGGGETGHGIGGGFPVGQGGQFGGGGGGGGVSSGTGAGRANDAALYDRWSRQVVDAGASVEEMVQEINIDDLEPIPLAEEDNAAVPASFHQQQQQQLQQQQLQLEAQQRQQQLLQQRQQQLLQQQRQQQQLVQQQRRQQQQQQLQQQQQQQRA